jgi:acylphosphatase
VKVVRVVVTGKVQGVWFRAWTVEEAAKRRLRGWVRNRRDGSVEALFAGDPGKVDEMVKVCHEGPPLAQVATVNAQDASDETIPEGFDQRRTG